MTDKSIMVGLIKGGGAPLYTEIKLLNSDDKS